jgi:hypothetical protein
MWGLYNGKEDICFPQYIPALVGFAAGALKEGI